MHILRLLPVLSLLLGARASPVDLSDEASHLLHERDAQSNVCLPVGLVGLAPGVGTSSTKCESTFSSYVYARVCF